MSNDDQQIRELIAAWMAATKAGDIEAVLPLMTDDAVFQVTGQEPFGKQGWIERSRPSSPDAPRPTFDGHSEILELRVLGDHAYARTKLDVIVTPADGGKQVKRAGYTMTVFRKTDGRWQLARDANMLVPVKD
ncbi:MAG TPA: SgcJ/EcaC family oxidoreductase [Steroidobacteraceae bacterium]|jgi:uncharacterized protein (TIGR02246 family)